MPQGNYLNAFRGPDLAQIDRDAYSNALTRNQVQRLPQQNRADDLSIQGAELDIGNAQQKGASDFLVRSFSLMAQDPNRAHEVINSQAFQTASKALQLPAFSVDGETPESIAQKSTGWAQALSGQSPAESYAQERGPDGSLLQRNLGTNQYTTLLGREPQSPTPANGPTPPSGYRYKPDGSLEATPGGPADPYRPLGPPGPKSMTEGDKRHALMYDSMVNAEQQISELVGGTDTSNKWDALLGRVGMTVAQSDAFKRYEAAGLRWAANMLYMKSGATATPEEIRSTWRQFFPQPGDGEAVKQQKNTAREQELTSAARITGNQYQPSGGGQPARIQSDADYEQLASGTEFVGPDGVLRKKP